MWGPSILNPAKNPLKLDARWLIAVILAVFAVLAAVPRNRREHLERWLASNRVLTPSERTILERGISRELALFAGTGPIPVSPPKLETGLNLVVVDGPISGVIGDLSGNAGYDPKLDVIFADRDFLLPSGEGPEIDEDLTRFILLHELGHRKLKHRGFAHFFGWADSSGGAVAQLQESEADAFALDRLLAALRDTELPDTAAWRLGDLIESTILGDLLAFQTASVAAASRSHPSLVRRSLHMMESLADRKDLTANARTELRLRLEFLRLATDAVRDHLWGEILVPATHQYGAATRTPFGAALLMSDGRLVLVDVKTLNQRRNERRRKALPAAVQGQPIPGLWFPELNSGAAFWWSGKGLALLRPYGRFYTTDAAHGWRWTLAAKLPEMMGKAIDRAHEPTRTARPTIVAVSPTTLNVYSVSTNPPSLKQLIELPQRFGGRELGQLSYEYVGATREAVFFVESRGNGRESIPQSLLRFEIESGEARGPQRMQVPSTLGRPSTPSSYAFQVTELGGRTVLAGFESEKQLLTVWSRPTGKSSRWQSSSLKLYGAEDGIPYRPLNFGGGIDRIHPIGDSTLVIELGEVGVFAHEIHKGSFQLVGLSRTPFFTVPMADLPLVLSASAGGWRAAFWRIDERGESDERSGWAGRSIGWLRDLVRPLSRAQ